jgi:hypothetical protein
MPILEKIESLRQQPKHIRNRYAFWTSLCVTLIVALVWGVQLPGRFSSGTEVVASKEADATGSSFVHTLGEMVTGLKASVSNFRGTIEYAKESTGEKSDTPKMLDLRALVASSTAAKQQQEKEAKASSTDSGTAPTNSRPEAVLPSLR